MLEAKAGFAWTYKISTSLIYIMTLQRQNKACMLTINYSTELHQENNNSVAIFFVIHTVHVLSDRSLVTILTTISRLHDHFTTV